MVKIAEGCTDAVKSFINLNAEQLGYLYPLSQERINRLFPPSSSCVLLNENEIVGGFERLLQQDTSEIDDDTSRIFIPPFGR